MVAWSAELAYYSDELHIYPLPCSDKYLFSYSSNLKGDIQARWSSTENHHPQPFKWLRLSIIMAVHLASLELLNIPYWRDIWHRVMAARGDNVGEDIFGRQYKKINMKNRKHAFSTIILLWCLRLQPLIF